MRFFLLAFTLLLPAACAVQTGPDPRDPFTERNIGKTVITYIGDLGTQAVYFEPSGKLYLWSGAQEAVQRGDWKFDILATGASTTYQGAGGINHPVQDLDTEWGICFRYLSADGQILRRREGGDWNCALLRDYEALIIDRGLDDIFQLSDGTAPAVMPIGKRLTGSDLDAL